MKPRHKLFQQLTPVAEVPLLPYDDGLLSLFKFFFPLGKLCMVNSTEMQLRYSCVPCTHNENPCAQPQKVRCIQVAHFPYPHFPPTSLGNCWSKTEHPVSSLSSAGFWTLRQKLGCLDKCESVVFNIQEKRGKLKVT